MHRAVRRLLLLKTPLTVPPPQLTRAARSLPLPDDDNRKTSSSSPFHRRHCHHRFFFSSSIAPSSTMADTDNNTTTTTAAAAAGSAGAADGNDGATTTAAAAAAASASENENKPSSSSSPSEPLPVAPSPATPENKLKSWEFFRSMGNPKYHVAPMVDQSELAFRMLTRNYGATCAYSPMIHARLFVEDPKYRREIFSTCEGDRPLLVQFCANDPEKLLEAAKIVAPVCDGVDINFGCPQRIAKKGRYGAFLMDDWKTIHNLISKLDKELSVPVTAKIRVYDDFETSLKYAKMVEAAGAQLIAIHGRTRAQKRASDVRANWAFIRDIKKELKVPVLANGDIRSFAEVEKCLEATGCDGVLSAEPLLENPSLFSNPPFAPPSNPEEPLPIEGDKNCRMLLEYLEMTDKYDTPLRMVKGHIHKMVGPWMSEFTDLRDWINKEPYVNLTNDALRKWTAELMGRINHVHKTEGRLRPIPKKSERALAREAAEAGLAAAIAEQEREESAVAALDAKRQKLDHPPAAGGDTTTNGADKAAAVAN